MADKFLTHALELPASSAGLRLDQALALALPQYSRAQLQRFVRAGEVQVEGRMPRASEHVAGGERVQVKAQPRLDTQVEAESLPLDIVHADEALLVINKPAGLVVHPGAGNRAHTLQNALLGFDSGLAGVPRAGLVHRLDKDTSGLLVVARTTEAHHRLVAAMQTRAIGREYLAVCVGAVRRGDTVDRPIGRHPTQRTRMAVRADGRAAITHYRVAERFKAHTLLRVILQTGRTHQIRVHLAHLGHPLLGDAAYNKGRSGAVTRAGSRNQAAQFVTRFPRQALHAVQLSLRHPLSGEALRFVAPLPEDLDALLRALRALETPV